MIHIFENLRFLHNSSQEEVVGLTLPGDESTHRRMVLNRSHSYSTERNVWLLSADARKEGTRDESVREFAGEVIDPCARNTSADEKRPLDCLPPSLRAGYLPPGGILKIVDSLNSKRCYEECGQLRFYPGLSSLKRHILPLVLD